MVCVDTGALARAIERCVSCCFCVSKALAVKGVRKRLDTGMVCVDTGALARAIEQRSTSLRVAS